MSSKPFKLQTGIQEYAFNESTFAMDSRFIPLGVAVISFVLEFVYVIFRSRKVDLGFEEREVRTTLLQRIKKRIHHQGGYIAYAFICARLVGTLSLVHLSVSTLGEHACSPDERAICPEYFLTLAFLYTAILSIISLLSKNWNSAAIRSNIVVLLAAFAVYTYRDLWPLATYNQVPKDASEGKVLWAKISILGFIAVVIPLFSPRRYVPVDPKHRMTTPNDELTASWISRLTFTYMDPVVLLGSKVEHIAHNQLPPLSDADQASVQKSRAFPHVDRFSGAKPRHLFFGLLKTFRKEYTIQVISLICQASFGFVAPIAINRVLIFLENDSAGSRDIRPWFWISWLLLGPLLESFSLHSYNHWNTMTRVRIEAVITELVFEHSLRIRLKAEGSGDDEKPTSSPPSQITSNAASVSGDDEQTINGDQKTRAENESSATQVSTVVGSSRTASESAQSITGKGKAKTKADTAEEVKAKKQGDSQNLLGRINNFVTSDLANILEGSDFLNFSLLVPLQITFCVVFFFKLLGWSAIVGLVGTVALSPVGGYLGKKIQDVQVVKMKLTDTRVQAITESVGILRMVKLFGWESKMMKRVEDKRAEELNWLWKTKVYRLAVEAVSMFIPTLTMLITFIAHTVIFKKSLNPSTIFPAMTVFTILREQLSRLSWQTGLMIDGKVSLDRVNDFIHNTELLDAYSAVQTRATDIEESSQIPALSTKDDEEIGFRNATFAWSSEDDTLVPSSRRYRLHIGDELVFKRGVVNLIVGPAGSGKTSMLMALLGEMHFMPSNPDSWFNLPRTGGVAYAAQESWVQNATIRENILFGLPFDEERYKKVINQCALEHDLELFDVGDATEVGERGLTLSGGQKARVTLARAIYSRADIILLDDVLAALDVHTATWVVDKCFKGDLVRGRTVLLVTHNIALASPIANFIVSIGLDGSVRSQGTEIAVALASDPALAAEVKHDQESLELQKDEEAVKKPENVKASPDGKLIMAEEIVVGHVTWKSMNLLLTGLGGTHPIFFAIVWISGMGSYAALSSMQPWFLGVWGSQYETHDPSDVNVTYYITIFTAIAFAYNFLFIAVNFYFQSRAVEAGRSIHTKLLTSIFGSTLRWLDQTPTSRIIARCTQDMNTIDNSIAQSFYWVVYSIMGMVTRLGVVVLFTPIFLLPGVVIAIVGIFIGNMYLRAQLSVKREKSNARSPLLAHFSAAIHGLVSVRAYGAQKSLEMESLKRIDHYSRTARISWDLNRWISVRIEGLGAIFTSALAAYLIYGKPIGAGNTGLSLTMANSFCTFIFWMIRIYNELEVESNSLERIQAYIDIEHEPRPTESGQPPAAWPASGELSVQNLSARYSQSGPKVLHDISFRVKSGERIGIVGRTGSGKSSLTLALLRCILTEGTVYLDGIPTDNINLDALRSRISIIPQTPELISGTLRQNLDPFDQNDDASLNDALRAAGLFSLQEEVGEARITLDTKVAGGGGNLSVGQRQIIALARAMVRGSKLLILDEATSAIDYKTDAVIQSTLRSQLNDVTVITVAHRLQTIMDADKIMVLDNGRIVEFDSPKLLLKKESGAFKALVDGSGDKHKLYELAGG